MSGSSSSVRRPLQAIIVALALATPPLEAQGAQAVPSSGAATVPTALVRFTPGETLRYDGFLGPLPVGGAEIAVAPVDTALGDSAWVFALRAKGGALGMASIDYKMRSWVRQTDFTTRRFHTIADQGGAPYERRYLVRGDSLRWREEGSTLDYEAPDGALDELAFLYFLRGIDLAPGDSLRIERYFKKGYNPVVVRALPVETVQAGNGSTHACRVYQVSAIGATSVLWLSDDERRIPVRAVVPLGVGPVTLRWTGRFGS